MVKKCGVAMLSKRRSRSGRGHSTAIAADGKRSSWMPVFRRTQIPSKRPTLSRGITSAWIGRKRRWKIFLVFGVIRRDLDRHYQRRLNNVADAST